MRISVADLQLGDIVFYTPNYTDEFADHVAIVTQIVAERNECYVTHATTGSYNQVTETLLHHDETTAYHIYRCNYPTLVKEALALAMHWEKLGIKFSEERHTLMELAQEFFGVENSPKNHAKHLDYAKEAYKENFFRIIKYAARRNVKPSRNKGFRCDQFIILLFQIAELKNMVEDLELLGVTWITDKYCTETYLKSFSALASFPTFNSYVDKLRGHEYEALDNLAKKDFNPPSKQKRFPSLLAWDIAHGDPKNHFLANERVLPIDCKVASPSVMMYHLNESSDNWHRIGELQVEPKTFKPEEKQHWQWRQQKRGKSIEIVKNELDVRCSKKEAFNLTTMPSPVGTRHLANFGLLIKTKNPKEKNHPEEKMISDKNVTHLSHG